MSFADDLSDMGATTVSWEACSGTDRWGKRTFSAAVTGITARLSRQTRLVRDDSGEVVPSSSTLWILEERAVHASDRITLADGSTPEILRVDRPEDELGNYHVKVFFR